MYKLLLILKYLRKRRIAWVSLVAVMLCTAMVLVVISVMGGWLRMFRASFHGLSGDVIVSGKSLAGFPYYQEMIDQIGKLPEVDAAMPTIRTYGLINIDNQIREGVQVIAFPEGDLGKVNNFDQSLWRQYQKPRQQLLEEANRPGLSAEERRRLREKADHPMNPSFDLLPNVPYEEMRGPVSKNWPGIIVGAGLVGMGKDKEGKVQEIPFLYDHWAYLTLLGVSADQTRIDVQQAQTVAFWIVDASRTQIWQYDSNTVYVPFKVAQRYLKMDEVRDENGNVEEPARTSDIQVKVKAGVDLQKAKVAIADVVQKVRTLHQIPRSYPILVQTWEESQALWLDAIENEKSLVTFLFSLISIVAIFLIFCIFYMIVVEKTKDIGIIKSVGATNAGVAGIFLGYGLAIGIAGAAAGLLFGYLIVHNINYLHTELGRRLGIVIWKPEVYAFDIIPNTMNPKEVAVIVLVAIVSSLLGALIPAWRAARMHPVEALRWE